MNFYSFYSFFIENPCRYPEAIDEHWSDIPTFTGIDVLVSHSETLGKKSRVHLDGRLGNYQLPSTILKIHPGPRYHPMSAFQIIYDPQMWHNKVIWGEKKSKSIS